MPTLAEQWVEEGIRDTDLLEAIADAVRIADDLAEVRILYADL